MNVLPFGLMDTAPPVRVPAYATVVLPSGVSLRTSLLSFCVTSRLPSGRPTRPSPLLPCCCQMNFHFVPPFTTPAMSGTVYSRGPAGAAARPAPPPRLPPGPRPPRAGGAFLHVAVSRP